MEITFMPRRKASNMNFLERFKGKVNKVDRYGVIHAVLDGRSLQYHSLENHRANISTINQSHSNSRTLEKHPSNSSSRAKNRVDTSIQIPAFKLAPKSRLSKG
jgi:hypothetical protein